MDILVNKKRYDASFISAALLCFLFLANTSHYLLALLPFSLASNDSFMLLVACGLPLIFYLCLKNRSLQLHLKLDHEQNQILCTDFNTLERFEVEATSKANSFGIWLSLRPLVLQDKSTWPEQNKTVFIARWQTCDDSFRALHRHLIWYLN